MARPDDDEPPTSEGSGGETDGESTLAEQDRFDDGPATLIKPDEREHEPLTVVKLTDDSTDVDEEVGDVRRPSDPQPCDADGSDADSPEPPTAVRESSVPEEPPEPKTTVMTPLEHPMDSTVRMPKVIDAKALPEPKTDKLPLELVRAAAEMNRKKRDDAAGVVRAPHDTEVLDDSSLSVRAALPTLITRVQKAQPWVQVLTLVGMFCGVLAIMLLVLRLIDSGEEQGESEPETSAETDAAARRGTSSPNPRPTSRATVAPASTPATPPPSAPDGDSEAEARAALKRFREGLEPCVVDNIHALPGTSPAVPRSLAYLARGPYQSLAGQWLTPVYACVKFSIEGPQRFVIQWQLDKAKKTGAAIAWTDDDGDGEADVALGFTATLDDDEVEVSEIQTLFPIPEISKRY